MMELGQKKWIKWEKNTIRTANRNALAFTNLKNYVNSMRNTST